MTASRESTKMREQPSTLAETKSLKKTEELIYDDLLKKTFNQIIIGKLKKTKFSDPKARISRYCHSRNDEASCKSFFNFIKRHDNFTQMKIIEEALIPDIRDWHISKTPIKVPRIPTLGSFTNSPING